MRSVSSLLTQQPSSAWIAQQKGGNNIKPHSQANQGAEPNESLQKKLWLGVAIAIIRFVSFLFLVEKKDQILSKNANKISGSATFTGLHRCL